MRQILDAILVEDPEKRATLDDLLNDEWTKEDGDVPATKAEMKASAIDADQGDIDNAIQEGVEETGTKHSRKCYFLFITQYGDICPLAFILTASSLSLPLSF